MKRWFLSAAIIAVLAGCATTKSSTGRTQLVGGVSQEQLNKLGVQAFTEAKSKGPLSNDAKQNAYVRCVVNALVRQLPARDQSTAWETAVFADKEPNAFALPGGKVGVNTGIFTVAKNQDQLAAVIGHEIAHALREHAREQALRDQQIAFASILVGAALKSEEAMNTAGRIGQIGYGFKYSRGAESEADLMGLELSARAGFDPRAAASLWRKMAANGQRPPEFLSTHPDPANREAVLAQAAQKLLPIYEQARIGKSSSAAAPAAAKKARRR